MSEQDFQVHIKMMINNLIADKTCQNIRTRKSLQDIREAHSCIKEELEEVREALTELEEEERNIWKLIREDAGEENILFRLEVLEMLAGEVLIEALDSAAVIRKTLIQLHKEKAPASGN